MGTYIGMEYAENTMQAEAKNHGLNPYDWAFLGSDQIGDYVCQLIYCMDGIGSVSIEMGQDGTIVSCMYDNDNMLLHDAYENTFYDALYSCYDYMEELEDRARAMAYGEPFYNRYGRA